MSAQVAIPLAPSTFSGTKSSMLFARPVSTPAVAVKAESCSRVAALPVLVRLLLSVDYAGPHGSDSGRAYPYVVTPTTQSSMSTDSIPGEHLLHLLTTYISPRVQRAANGSMPAWFEDLVRKAKSSSRGDKDEVLKYLDAQYPGTAVRLTNLYAFSGRRSINLWSIPELQGAGVVRAFARRIPNASSLRPDQWLNVQDGAPSDDHVVRILLRHDAKEASAIVMRHEEFSFSDAYGHRKTDVRSSFVELRLMFKYQTPLLEVHADIRAARTAALTFLRWLLGHDIPSTKSAAQEKTMVGVTFTEPQITRMAASRGWSDIVIDGVDPTNEVGERVLRGKKSGQHREPLDTTRVIVQQQTSARNDHREYSMIFTHQTDGYQERAEFGFVFKARPPHITFSRTVTQPVVDSIIDGVYRLSGGS